MTRGLFGGTLAAILLLGCTNVMAYPITYDFQVTALTGPLAGTSSAGTFTFDSGIIPNGGGSVTQVGLLDDLAFTWNGTTFDESAANTGALFFTASGMVPNGGAWFGTNCTTQVCTVTGTNAWAVIGGMFYYATPAGLAEGTVSLTPTPSVPEPASLTLLGLGLAGLAAAIRRRLPTQDAA